jgi:hypothetical protein
MHALEVQLTLSERGLQVRVRVRVNMREMAGGKRWMQQRSSLLRMHHTINMVN